MVAAHGCVSLQESRNQTEARPSGPWSAILTLRLAWYNICTFKCVVPGSLHSALPEKSGWGGRRAGAGRKPTPGSPTWRPASRDHGMTECAGPCDATARVGPAARRAVVRGSSGRARCVVRKSFRVLQFSVQSNHPHLVVEADHHDRAWSPRPAKAINRVLGRHGTVWSDRYHARPPSTPREVRTR